MLFESRSIIFSDEELAEAMQPLFEERGMDNVVQLHPKHNNAGEVVISVEQMNGEDGIDITVPELAPVILQHCLNKNVPMPRDSKKELAMRGDHLALIIHMQVGSADTSP